MQLVDADGDGAGAWKLANRYLYGDMVDMILADEQLPSGGIALDAVSSTSGEVLWPLGDRMASQLVRSAHAAHGVFLPHQLPPVFSGLPPTGRSPLRAV